MRIREPSQLLAKLDAETLARLEDSVSGILRFLGPEDTFKFKCDRRGHCCQNRTSDPVVLSPYDAFRLQTRLGLSSDEFARSYADKILGSESELPFMILRTMNPQSHPGRCILHNDKGCTVYHYRPLVCRLFPLGRVIDRDMNSYFFIPEFPDYCGLGRGGEYTVEEWLKQVDAYPGLDWNERYHCLLMNMDYQKYQRLSLETMSAFGEILYNFDHAEEIANLIGVPAHKVVGALTALDISYESATGFLESRLK